MIKKESRRGMGNPAAMVIVGNAGWRPASGNSTKPAPYTVRLAGS